MGDDLGVGLGDEGVALRLQLVAQLVVVLDDAVVNQADPAHGRQTRRLAALGRARSGPCEKCGWALWTSGAPCVAQRVWAMPVPLSSVVGDDVGGELGDARGAARPLQPAALMNGDAA